MNYNKIKFNNKYSDGQYKKTVSNKKLMDNIENFKFTSIDKGIKKVCKWFIKNYKYIRK
jgi:GDP-L-fucose synthase